MKRIISFFLAVCMAAAIFSGCGSKNDTVQKQDSKTSTTQSTAQSTTQNQKSYLNETGFPIVNNPITVKAVIQKVAVNGDFSDMYFFREMEKKTGIKMEFNAIDQQIYSEKKNLMFAANELPDLFLGAGLSTDDQAKYGSNGTLIPLNDLIMKYAAALNERNKDCPDLLKTVTTTDGKIYSLPVALRQRFNLPLARQYINVKWIKDLGLKTPETLDDFYNVLVAFRDKNPGKDASGDTIPLSGMYKNYSVAPVILGALGLNSTMYMNVGDSSSRLDEKDGKVIYIPLQPEYKEYLTFMNKLFKEKLLDQEYFTQNEAQYKAKGNVMRLGMFFYSAHYTMVGQDDPERWSQYQPLMPLTSKFNSEKIWPVSNGVITGGASITKINKYPEATVRWLDFLYTEEGANMLYWYPEKGKWDGEGGYVWTDDKKTEYNVERSSKFSADWNWRNSFEPAANGIAMYFPTDLFDKQKLNDSTKDFRAGLNKLADYGKNVLPGMFMTKEEQDSINMVTKEIETYAQQMDAKFIMGTEPLDKFDDFVNTLKKMGVDDMLDKYQAAYDRYKNAK